MHNDQVSNINGIEVDESKIEGTLDHSIRTGSSVDVNFRLPENQDMSLLATDPEFRFRDLDFEDKEISVQSAKEYRAHLLEYLRYSRKSKSFYLTLISKNLLFVTNFSILPQIRTLESFLLLL